MRNNEWYSNCCGGDIMGADHNGHGKCGDCRENCTPGEPEDESEYTTIREFQDELYKQVARGEIILKSTKK